MFNRPPPRTSTPRGQSRGTSPTQKQKQPSTPKTPDAPEKPCNCKNKGKQS